MKIENPAELAQTFALELMEKGALDPIDGTAEESHALVELDRLAAGMGMLDEAYFVESGKSFIVPTSFERSEAISTIHFDALRFRGELKTFSTVRMRTLLGRQSIKALCLTFDNVRMLPFFNDMEDGHLLHVPAFAVQTIDRTAA